MQKKDVHLAKQCKKCISSLPHILRLQILLYLCYVFPENIYDIMMLQVVYFSATMYTKTTHVIGSLIGLVA